MIIEAVFLWEGRVPGVCAVLDSPLYTVYTFTREGVMKMIRFFKKEIMSRRNFNRRVSRRRVVDLSPPEESDRRAGQESDRRRGDRRQPVI